MMKGCLCVGVLRDLCFITAPDPTGGADLTPVSTGPGQREGSGFAADKR